MLTDTFITASKYQLTREKRGKGTRMRVTGKNKIPGDWRGTKAIFALDFPEGKQVLVTSGDDVLT
jgi:hypothetical protein